MSTLNQPDETSFYHLCFAGIVKCRGQTPEYVPTSGLVSWWNLNGDAIDEVGGNDGIQFGTSPTPNRQGQEGQALGFDGDDYVSLDTFFGGAQMTEASYSLWFNSTDNGGTQFISGKEGYWRTIYVRLDCRRCHSIRRDFGRCLLRSIHRGGCFRVWNLEPFGGELHRLTNHAVLERC